MARVVLNDAYLAAFEHMQLAGEEVISLKLRTQLLLEVKKTIEAKRWSRTKAAAVLKVKAPRVSEIMGLRIDKFSVELLLKYLDRLGKRVNLNISTKR
jgi:predicted XRE-type DNA-binding protein